ncbi:MAG TPA: GTPase [Sedimentisphaerales bacterium]|nr:GTPase [Sedimentisphaerales bacterium]
MPANLTPEYFKAEQWYRTAGTNEEKILAVERMLAVMPKHKGTDHLKADLRRKLSKLKDAAQQKSKSSTVDVFHIPGTGSGQIVLLGTPNCGKSSIVAALTNARVNVADFPFATAAPAPGMMQFEDVQIQLVDMPPITADYIAPGQVGTYRHCDLIAVVVDLSGDVKDQLRVCLDFLEARNLLIDTENAAADDRGNILAKKAMCICTKFDISRLSTLEKLKKLCKYEFEFVQVSTKTGAGMDTLAETFFRLLHIIRIYAKPPGKKPDMDEPFTLPAGSTVMDMATAIHRQLAERLKSARIWGKGVRPGQNVQKNHVLNDKDIIELHFA